MPLRLEMPVAQLQKPLLFLETPGDFACVFYDDAPPLFWCGEDWKR